jgi:integrase/recombinase XerD
LPLSKAISGFLQYKTAEGLSPNTLVNYQHDLNVWLAHQGDTDIGRLESKHVRDFLVWLRTDYKPRRFTGNTQPLAPKTIHNIYISLSAFFTWATTEFEIPSPMKGVPAPHYQVAPVEAFSKDDVEALLKACEYCKEARPTDRRRFTMRRSTGHRDQAIILTLLDTGLRASELSALKIGDIDLKTGKVLVKHGRIGGAKGGKGRMVFLGKTARRAM